MNIFFLHFNPRICAQLHVDKHVIKMILETCQLLCSAVHLCGDYTPCYKLTHKNHPCSKWVRESSYNYNWLCKLGLELCYEYTYRYGKIHKCQKYITDLKDRPPNLPNKGLTKPAQAMPDLYKIKNIVESYRYYYVYEKNELLCWRGKISGREQPIWVNTMLSY